MVTCSFGLKSGICFLIAPVPVHCFSITFFQSLDGKFLGQIIRMQSLKALQTQD